MSIILSGLGGMVLLAQGGGPVSMVAGAVSHAVQQAGNSAQPAGNDYLMLTQAAANHEKVYLQLDRRVYVAGSTVRFRGFLVNARLQPGGAGSKILYLELNGSQMDSSLQWRTNVHEGSCAGSFVLPHGLKGGMYSVRAFTSWMRNGKPDYMFAADIMVLGIAEAVPDRITIYREEAPPEGIVSFYPEGGQLLNGIVSNTGYRVNFRVNGLLPDTLRVMEDDSLVAAEIVTAPEGFGSFDFVPDISKSYQAQLIYPGGQVAVARMPVIADYGYVLHAEDVAGGLMVTVRARPEPRSVPSSLRLVAIAGGALLLDASFPVPPFPDTHQVFVPAGDRQKAVVNLTLYDSRRFLLCQQLAYYEDLTDSPEIRVNQVESLYRNGETVEMEIGVTGLAAGDVLSMAVTVSEVGPLDELVQGPGIEAYFPVSSEFGGITGLFNNGEAMGKQQIRDMLLCLDPRDHAWNYYSGTRLPDCTYDLERNGYILKGRVLNGPGKEPLRTAHVLLNVEDSASVSILYSRTDTLGRFYFVLDPSYDRKDIILQLLDQDYANLTWELEDKVLVWSEKETVEHVLSDSEREYIDQSVYLQVIDEVYQENRDGENPPVRTETGLPYLAPNSVIYPADYEEMNSFREITENILPAVRFTARNQQFRVGIFDRTEELWLESDWVFLNGVLFRDLAYIATLGSKDIERIEIHSTKILLGKTTLQGFLSIYTAGGQIPENYLADRACVYRNEVLPDERTIWTGPDSASSAHPDLRQTLLWAPDVRISGEETAKLTFSTSRLDGQYGIMIQGITKSGIPISRKLHFRVQ